MRQTCPSNECLLSAMMRGRSVSFVWLRTESLVTKSYHYVLDAPLCLHVKSLQSGGVGFGQSPRLRSMQQDGLNKGRVDRESQFRIQTESPVSPYSVQLRN